MLRTAQSLPQEWAFDTGLRPRPFPDEAASLLPGPLAATRTGLTPASDDELTTQDQPPTRSTSCLLGARKELNEAVLAHSVGFFRHDSEVDVGLVYADYYLLEAISRLHWQ